MQRVSDYLEVWEKRCYLNNGIPNELPPGLASTNRAPSWKSIAVAILRNDHNLYSLGFARPVSDQAEMLRQQKLRLDSPQIDMFETH